MTFDEFIDEIKQYFLFLGQSHTLYCITLCNLPIFLYNNPILMKKNSDLYYKIALVIIDILALLIAFTSAYILRVTLDPRPLYIHIRAIDFITSIATLLPLWVALFYFFRLYDREIYTRPLKESGRLLLASVFGIMLMISFSFFTNTALFPTKLVAVYAMLIGFIVLLLMRIALNLVRLQLLRKGIGIKRAIIIGNSDLTRILAEYLDSQPVSGYKLCGIVAKNEFIPLNLRNLKYSTLSIALTQTKADAIIQTDDLDSAKNYQFAEKYYLEFFQSPALDGPLASRHSVEFINSTPLILFKPTALSGYSRIIKRVIDIIGSSIGLIIASPIMLLIAIAIKLDDPAGPVFMRGKQQKRLTRYNRVFKVYKFRSHYAKFDGKTDEEVFMMVGKPELIEEYRKNGDKLDIDFRITRVGKFIRRFSLDELPQLINVFKGDISLVGPRALVPHELNKYDKKDALLSVKSGLTGLAVVSGRRDISFDERRRIDLYYVQNWSLWLDISILLRTVGAIFRGG